jgi:Ca2+-transporting ATPase
VNVFSYCILKITYDLVYFVYMPEPSLFSFWASDSDIILKEFSSSENGLDNKEAAARLTTYGPNTITSKNKHALLYLVWNQCKSPLVIILAVAMVLSFVLGKTSEAFFVMTAILVNISLGIWQEWKANSAIKKLESYITTYVKVTRDGARMTLDSSLLVPGDIVTIRGGDTVPADIRLLTSSSLEVDESILTGESLAVKKDAAAKVAASAPLTDRGNMVWSGTIATDGEATGVVVETGNKTELGAIAALVGHVENEKTPLEKSVAHLATGITIFLVLLGAVIFLLGLRDGYLVADILLIAIAVIVSAVPESLPIAMSTVLAIGASTLAKKKGVVRKMAATETLGAVTLILTDKTGTLTEGKLTFENAEAEDGDGSKLLLEAYQYTSTIVNKDGGISGRPLEVAIYQACKSRPEFKDLFADYEVIERLMFNSTQKFGGVLFAHDGHHTLTLVGAPDILLEKTTLSQEEKDTLHHEIQALADKGERIIGVVHKKVSYTHEGALEKHVGENTFVFRGLLRFRDQVRESVPMAVHDIQTAGVRVAMVTGDHPGTARAIAKEVGIWHEGDTVLTGSEIALMSDDELVQKIATTTVFARTTPEQKLRLVEAYGKRGEVVAVTGDGVNDAPALKRAEIGVAMGSGTDVARGAADVVILDDNFETIVAAIFEGRGVLYKMRTVITYLLADSFDELLLVGGSIIAGLILPISALQILFVKFFADIFPAMAFTFETIDGKRVAHRAKRTTLFDREIKMFTFGRGFVASALLFAIYLTLSRTTLDQEIVRTFIFASFATYILFLAFSMRRLDESLWKYKMFSNKYLTIGVALGFGTTMLAIYWPWLSGLLGTTALPLPWLIGVFAIGFVNLFIMEGLKRLMRPRISTAPI